MRKLILASSLLFLAACSTPKLPDPTVPIAPFPPTLMAPPQIMKTIPTEVTNANSIQKKT